jgi:hypothetical protein
MDSRPSNPQPDRAGIEPGDATEYITRFQEAARRGDWSAAGRFMAELKRVSLPENLPTNTRELEEHLQRLQHALAIARASRAAAAGTLSRLTAVANFNRAIPESQPKRQNLVDLTSY